MKLTKVMTVVSAAVLGSVGGIVFGQIPIDPQNRILDGKIYNPAKSTLWINMPAGVTKDGSKLVVKQVGKISIGCAVYRAYYDDGGAYGVYSKLGDEYVKEILIYNHPAHDSMTTGTIIDGRGKTPITKPFFAMRVANWRTNNLVLEAYDCGLPDTVENRNKFGVPVLAAGQTADSVKQTTEVNNLKRDTEQAAKGDAYGLLRMGERYRDGDGVPKNLKMASEYFTKASTACSAAAADALSRLDKTSTNSPAKQ